MLTRPVCSPVTIGLKRLKYVSVADTCGEHLAWFFGITTPKYQSAIDEFYRLKSEVRLVSYYNFSIEHVSFMSKVSNNLDIALCHCFFY